MFCNRTRRRTGFSLVELMVVVVILGLLATLVTINVQGYLTSSRQEKARMEVATLKDAVMLFATTEGRLPTNEEGLARLREPTESNPGGVLSSLPTDPWGRPYVYIQPGLHGEFDILCYGRDGVEGGTNADKDICSWELEQQ